MAGRLAKLPARWLLPLASLLAPMLWLGCGQVEAVSGVSYDDRYEIATMDVYLPSGGGDARPAVLLVHGGGWRNGGVGQMARLARRLARSGFVTANIDYRLVPDAIFPSQVQDVKCALVFLRSMAGTWGLDPDRIAIAGYSAGAHLSALTAVTEGIPELEPDCAAVASGEPARVAAVVPGEAPFDLEPFAWSTPVTEFLGGTLDEVPAVYALASPINHVAPGLPPFLIVQGTNDLFATAAVGERMHEALLAAGVDSRILRITGGGHITNASVDGSLEPGVTFDTPEGILALTDFLYEVLGAP